VEYHKTITSADVQEAITDAFRRVVGRHKPHSVSEISTLTGRCDSYWGNVRSGLRTPGVTALLGAAQGMDKEHGAAFLNEILALAGYTGVRPIEATETCALDVIKHSNDTIRLCAEVLEDGIVTQEEALKVAARLRQYDAMADGISATSRRVA